MPVTSPSPSDRENPVGRDRGDACPGALRLHGADDGALARIRLPGGLLTARQAESLAGLAHELGDGNLDLTSRGNVQLRGLAPDCGAELGARLRAAGLLPSDRHDRVRNVAASPLCGLDDRRPTADVQAWTRELDRLLCGADPEPPTRTADLSGLPDLSQLSGRFLFGLDDGRGDITALAPDVTLIAEANGSALLCYAATGPCLRLAAADAPRAAALAARHFLDGLRARGLTAWRVGDLPPQDRPDTGLLRRRLAAAGITAAPGGLLPPPAAPPEPGCVHGPGGRTALSVAAPLGRLTTAQWLLLAHGAAQAGDGTLRVTPWRGVVLPGLPAREAVPRLTALAAAGLVTSPASAWHGAGACAGHPGCAKSRADVRADATACLTSVRPAPAPEHRGTASALPVYWSGCERRCGHPGGRWVDVLATGDGYRVAVRDGAREESARTVPAARSADAVAAARATGPAGDAT
ncbi:cobalamin biosynthesis protein CobG [Streptomyces gamaensis]|uniref:Cobalamin biosynthesis protein CobG n=1 Tax=Streptomyces gamaensis TaxID=1763542 RepID=A0ABW0Z155_9ACTN